MKVIHIAANQASSDPLFIEHSAIAIGNFDGVHLGHQNIISQLRDTALKNHLAKVVISFEPYPREYFTSIYQSDSESNDESLQQGFRLMSEDEKIHALSQYDIDYLIIIRFNEHLAAMSAESFVEEFLVNKLNVKALFVGNDFRCGHRRAGDVNLLKQLAKSHNYEITIVDDFEIDDLRVSSSLIRDLLVKDDLKKANRLLGRPHTFIGEIVHGDKRGREIGFATANIEVAENKLLMTGVFAIKASIAEHSVSSHSPISEPLSQTKLLDGVCNLGFRPTYHSDVALLEVHLFDWHGDIYGQSLIVEFIDKIRDEKKFDNFDELKQQIHNDALTARKILS